MWRELLRMRARALAVVLTVASAVAVFVGMYTGLGSLFFTRDSLYARLDFADLEVQFVPEDLNNFPSLDGLEGVAGTTQRLVFPGILTLAEGTKLAAVLTLLDTGAPSIDRLEILEGRTFRDDEPDAFVIDRSLAEYHGYEVGDHLAIEVGEKNYEGTVVGIAVSPEYLVATSNPDYFAPQKGSLGIVWGNMARVEAALGFTIVNDLLFRFEPGVDREAVKRRVLERLDKLNVSQVVTKERQFGARYISTQLRAIAHFLPAMVILLTTLAAVITTINFSRLIATERREIGVLMAVGYSPWPIFRSYVEGALVLGLAGSLVGVVLSFPMRDLFAGLSANSMGMPFVLDFVNPGLLLRGFLMGVVVTVVSAALPVVRLLRLALNDVLQDPGRRVEKGRWSSQSRLLPASLRYGIRNLLRQRGRAIATVGSVALALGVATGYRVSAKSIDETLTRRFGNERWDIAVDFLYPVYLDETEDIAGLPGVEESGPYLRRYVELHASGRSADTVWIGTDPRHRMTTPPVVSGRRESEGFEVLLTHGLADKLGVDAGDVVTTEVFGHEYRFVVAGVTSDVVSDLALVPLSACQAMFELDDKVSGVYLRTGGAEDDILAALQRVEFVGKTFEKRQYLVQFKDVIAVMVGVLDLAAAINIFVAVLFVLTSINLSVLETEGEFATLKAVGYGPGALGRIVFTEAGAEALGAALLSLPVGFALSVYLNARLSESWFQVDNFFLASEYAKLLLPALVLVPLGAYPGFRHVRDVDISLALRDRIGQ